jgi:hypothetical protein
MRQHCAGSRRDLPCGTVPADTMRHPPGDRPPCLAASGVLGSQRGVPARGRPPSSARGRAGFPRMGRALWGGQRRWGAGWAGAGACEVGRWGPRGGRGAPWGWRRPVTPVGHVFFGRPRWPGRRAGRHRSPPRCPSRLSPAVRSVPAPVGSRPSPQRRLAFCPHGRPGRPQGLAHRTRRARARTALGPPGDAAGALGWWTRVYRAAPALRGWTTCWGTANNPSVGFRHGGALARARGSWDARPSGVARRCCLPPPCARSGLAPQGPWVVSRGRGVGGWCRTKTVPRRRKHP